MTSSQYQHLKLKVFKSEFKCVLLEAPTDLMAILEAAENMPLAIFRGDSEFSAILPVHVPCEASKTEPDWICLRIIGEMPFGSVQGLIAEISGILAKKSMGICVISTFLTDWFFIKSRNKELAVEALKDAGWEFVDS